VVDILDGVRAYLMENGGVQAALQGGVYVGELEGAEIPLMPRRTAVIVPAGGMDNRSYIQVSSPRITIWCYGASYVDCSDLDLAIADAMSSMKRTRQAVSSGFVLLHSAFYAGGPYMARDPDTDWPVVHRDYTVTAAEIAA
jgi:hypothetical protein